MEVKFFATSASDAEKWGRCLGSNEIISIKVLSAALHNTSITYFPKLVNIGLLTISVICHI